MSRAPARAVSHIPECFFNRCIAARCARIQCRHHVREYSFSQDAMYNLQTAYALVIRQSLASMFNYLYRGRGGGCFGIIHSDMSTCVSNVLRSTVTPKNLPTVNPCSFRDGSAVLYRASVTPCQCIQHHHPHDDKLCAVIITIISAAEYAPPPFLLRLSEDRVVHVSNDVKHQSASPP